MCSDCKERRFRISSMACLLSLLLVFVTGGADIVIPGKYAGTTAALAREGSGETFGKVLALLVQKRLEARKVARDEKKRAVHAAMIGFYAEHQAPIWVGKRGWNAKALAAMRTFQDANWLGLKASDYHVPDLDVSRGGFDLESRTRAEIGMTKAVLHYMRDARGGRIDPSSLTASLDVKPDLGDPAADLKALAVAPEGSVRRVLEAAHPVHPQFHKLSIKLGELLRKDGNEKDITRILLNMERYRYLPRKLANSENMYIQNNIPELKSRIINNDQVVFEEKIIVGKGSKKTPIFSDQIEWVEIHPTWYIPNSIKKKDIYPRIKRGSRRILERFNIRLNCGVHGSDPAKIDWSKVKITSCSLTQPPSRLNVLGFFKFKFPNKHSVYMHDTDDRYLFKRKYRLLSHGCMRVQHPKKMAVVLLRSKGITEQQINKIIKGPRRLRKEVLKEPVPIHITYFTAIVNERGEVKTYPDVYGHDRRMARALYNKANLFPAPRYVSSRRYKRKPRPVRKKKDWRREVMGGGF